MSKSSILLLGDTSGKFNVTGDAVRADGWYGYGDGVHTVAAHLHNFTGRFYIEASLANTPEERDWFAIWLNPTVPYAEFPRDPAHVNLGVPALPPLGQRLYVPHGQIPRGDTGVEAFTFRGNLMWLRARLDRTYMGFALPTPGPDFALDNHVASYGVIAKVLLNH